MRKYGWVIPQALVMVFFVMTSFEVMHAGGQRYNPIDAQERHIENSDRLIQDNSQDIKKLLIRIEGDEDFLKGALGVIGFMQSLGLIKSFQKKHV